ncbi:MAG: alkaline phosphatase D family protein [Myxococcales bacterium]|nr:alkaline phosphatase D family protein [Myxococcales bacterium]MCB9643819.1 alkaline phosphatase D family protein [Myxococcales bacterium]
MVEQKKRGDQEQDALSESSHRQEAEKSESSILRDLSRRDFLRMGAASAVGLSLGVACTPPVDPEEERIRQAQAKCGTDASQDKAQDVAFDPTTIKEDNARYMFGVQAGSVTMQSALLWTFSGDEQPRTLRVWRASEKSGSVMLVTEKEVSSKEGYFHQMIEGLTPNQEYFYAFFSGKDGSFTDRTRIGRFRTAFPEGCLQPLTVAATACTNAGKYQSFPALDIMAKRKVDLFCHLGDMSYNDGANTKEEFRAKWKRTIEKPGYPEIFSSAGMYSVWDDHEYTDNNELYKGKPQVFFDTARAAYFEHVAQTPGENGRLWRSYRWGDVAEFFLLDCRTERDISTYGTDNAVYMSDAQFTWLKEGIKNSKCHFKVLLNSVPITDFPELWDVLAADRWEGYKTQRKALFDFILANEIRNVWFLSGDFHVGAVARLDATGPMSGTWEILAGPGGNYSVLWGVYQAQPENRDLLAPDKQFDFFHGENTATFVTFDPIKDEVRVEFVQASNEKVLLDKTFKQTFPKS